MVVEAVILEVIAEEIEEDKLSFLSNYGIKAFTAL